MKRGTPEHPKTLQLSALLNIRQFEAVGLLEMLWHWTARYAPQGDIGKYPNAMIAGRLDWQEDPEMLFDALTRAAWIEEHEEYRLVIHDWHEHSDDACDKYLAAHDLMYWNGSSARRKSQKSGKKTAGTNTESRLGAEKSRLGAEKSRLGAEKSRLGAEKSGLGAEKSGLGAEKSGLSYSYSYSEPEPHCAEVESSVIPAEEDPGFKLLKKSDQLNHITVEQWVKLKQEFAAAPTPIDWLEIATAAVDESQFWTEHIDNPALWIRKGVYSRLKEKSGAADAAAPTGSAPYVPLSKAAAK